MLLVPLICIVPIASHFAPLADTVRARVTATIGESSPTPFLLGEVSGLAVDDAGRVYVSDFKDPRIVVFSGDGKRLAVIGRKGKGPGEFDAPTGPVIAADGSLYVRNMQSVLHFVRDPATGIPSKHQGTSAGPAMAPWMSKLASVIDKQGRFHFPQEVGLRDHLTHYAYRRYALDGKVLDSLPVPVQPTTRSSWASVMVAENTGRMVKGIATVPFHPMPAWTVSPAGTIIGGPADRYELTETDVAEKVLRRITRAVTLDAIPAAERADSLKALKRRIDSLPVPLAKVDGVSAETAALKLPMNYPAYRTVSATPTGELWVRRWSAGAFKRSSVFDVFNPAGAYQRSVIVPADCATLPAPVVRGSTLACVAIDGETGSESVVVARTGGER